MIYWCNDCARFVYSHDMSEEGVCPFCGGADLQITDEDLKIEYETLNKKLAELTDDELKQVVGGEHNGILASPGTMVYAPMIDDMIGGGDITPTSTQTWFGDKE